VSRSGLDFGFRVVVVALAWVAVTLGSRPASAAGCHVRERPVLGLTFSEELGGGHPATPEAHADARPPAFVPIPCSGETPSSTAGDTPAPPSATRPSADQTPPAPGGVTPPYADRCAKPRLDAERLDRPPRS